MKWTYIRNTSLDCHESILRPLVTYKNLIFFLSTTKLNVYYGFIVRTEKERIRP